MNYIVNTATVHNIIVNTATVHSTYIGDVTSKSKLIIQLHDEKQFLKHCLVNVFIANIQFLNIDDIRINNIVDNIVDNTVDNIVNID